MEALYFSWSGVSATPSRHPRDNVAASQPEARGGYHLADDFVLCHVINCDEMNKLLQLSSSVSFILRGDMFGIISRICYLGIPYSQSDASPIFRFSIVSRNRSRAAEPRWGMNRLLFTTAVSARRWWVVVSLYGISSPIWCRVLGISYSMMYLHLFKASLLFSLTSFYLAS
jgi:hypothetical protein